jgi:hypothetical protein
MVPLDRVVEKPAPSHEPLFVPPEPAPREPTPPEPRAPRRFKIVDVVSQEVLGEDLPARDTVAILGGVRSMVDVHVFVWQPTTARWRRLTFDEQRLLWDRREASPVA